MKLVDLIELKKNVYMIANCSTCNTSFHYTYGIDYNRYPKWCQWKRKSDTGIKFGKVDMCENCKSGKESKMSNVYVEEIKNGTFVIYDKLFNHGTAE